MTQVLAIIFATYTNTFGLPPGLLESVCFIESKHQVTAYRPHDGHTPSVGVCQVKWSTAKDLGFKGTEKDLMDPSTNVFFAAKYLKKQIERYKSIERGVVAYNRGNAKGLRTTAYSTKVMKQWREQHVQKRR